MTVSHAPQRPATQQHKRKPLSPARVYQAWQADCSQHGRRGAFRRTAELVGCSPEYIRQLVAKHESEHTLKPEAFTAHELDYLPAPGEIPLARPTQPVPIATKEATPSTPVSCDDYVKPDAELNVNSCETSEESQLATDKQPQPTERETVVLPLDRFAIAAPQTPALRAPVFPDTPVKRYAPRPARRPAHADVLDWLRGTVFAPGPALALLVFLLLVLWLAR